MATPAEAPIQRGYLLLADISGFTEFLADGELAHAPVILENLISFLVPRLSSALTVAEIEGDAVFAYAEEEQISRGELLLELIECTYVDFRDMQRTMVFNATCPCRACMATPSLDLKFVVHHGEFAVQNLAGRRKPVGSSVNLAHRLLKNHVAEQTGWRGYALLTEPCLEAMHVELHDTHDFTESYPHLGDVRTRSIDLDRRYEELTQSRTVRLEREGADLSITHHLSAPPPIVWDWLNDPLKRTAWWQGSEWEVLEQPTGRTAPSSKNHCRQSGMIEHVLDLRPFHYITVRQEMGLLKTLITEDLEEEEGGTRLTMRLRLEVGLPRWLSRAVARTLFLRVVKLEERVNRMDELSSRAFYSTA